MPNQNRTTQYKGSKTRITISMSVLTGGEKPQKKTGFMANIGNDIYAMFKYGNSTRGYMNFVH